MTGQARAGRTRTEHGSASIEAVIGVPAFVMFIALIVYGGRLATAHQALESAASDAARAASIARTVPSGTNDARQAALTSLANQQLDCRDVDVRIDATALTKPAGQPGAVRVEVTCRLDISDLALPGVPGTRVLTATMASPVDTWRQQP